jgi:hypothetical protein
MANTVATDDFHVEAGLVRAAESVVRDAFVSMKLAAICA